MVPLVHWNVLIVVESNINELYKIVLSKRLRNFVHNFKFKVKNYTIKKSVFVVKLRSILKDLCPLSLSLFYNKAIPFKHQNSNSKFHN